MAGRAPADIVGRLAASAGLGAAGAVMTPRQLLDAISAESLWPRLNRAPAVWTG